MAPKAPSFVSRNDTLLSKLLHSSLEPEPWLKERETRGRGRGREQHLPFASERDNNTSRNPEEESQEGGTPAGDSKLDEGERGEGRKETGPAAVSGLEGEDAPKIGLAFASAGAAILLFFATRFGGGGVDLGSLAAMATPYDEALANGRPTVVEFYADWCEVCRELAKDVYGVEMEYRDKVNFVMLNIDNVKWAQELDEFGVEGIPHFVFLDGDGNEEGNIVGKLPRKFLIENVLALSQGEKTIPHSQVVGNFSVRGDREIPTATDPRSHGK